jgi:short-subunit dehydrogenase
MAKVDWTSLRVAITGASSGIGAATARALATKGASVAMLARRKDRLAHIAKECQVLGAPKTVIAQGDVSVWEDLEAFAATAKKGLAGDVDVVIANAGYGQIGNTLDMPPLEVQRLFQTNTIGAIWTVQAFAHQLENQKGHVIVTGSVVSKVAVPYSSIYSASKWALRGWTRGARPELESRGITITLFNPGYVRTEFFEKRRNAKGIKTWNPGRGMSADQVATRMVGAIRRRPAEMEMSALSRVAIPMYRMMPIQSPRFVAKKIRHRADSRFVEKD